MARSRRKRREFKDSLPGKYWDSMKASAPGLDDDGLALFWYRRLFWNYRRHWEYSDDAYLDKERAQFYDYLDAVYDIDFNEHFDWEEWEKWY